MKVSKLKFYIYSLIYSQIKHTRIMTQNMRSPDNGFLGNIAKCLMINFNEFIINDSVQKLEVKKNDEVIEIGSGNGQAIEKILRLTKNRITSIEVSKKFRNQLIEKFKNKNVVFFSNDAKQMSNIIKNNTFTKLLGINVIYFLHPISDYAKEFYRILKFGGHGLLACKFEGIKDFDEKTAPNKNLSNVIKEFEKVGFTVDTEFIDSTNKQKKYHAIYIRKIKNEN